MRPLRGGRRATVAALLAYCAFAFNQAVADLADVASLVDSGRAGAVKAAVQALQRQHAKKWTHKAFDDVRTGVDADEYRLFHARGRRSSMEHVSLPIEITVVLLGLDGTGGFGISVSPADLESYLSAALKQHCPTIGDARERGRVCYDVVFTVRHAEVPISALEQVLRVSMTASRTLHADAALGDEDSRPRDLELRTVEATAVEPMISKLLSAHFALRDGPALNYSRLDNTIVLMNPSKLRMSRQPRVAGERPPAESPPGEAALEQLIAGESKFPERWDSGEATWVNLHQLEGGYRYTYKYNGAGRLATWISASHFTVVDLAAGPCSYGPEASPSGVVTPVSIPVIADLFRSSRADAFARAAAHPNSTAAMPSNGASPLPFDREGAFLRRALLQGGLATAVMSAALHVFMPDVAADVELPFASKLLVPVIVLRNHQRFNPLDLDEPWSIDLVTLQEQAQAIADPGQTVVVLSGLHQLAAHPGLAVAVQAAMSCRSEAVLTGWERAAAGRAMGVHARTSHYVDGDVLLERFASSSDVLMEVLMGGGEMHSWMDSEWGTEVGEKSDAPGSRILPIFVLSLVDVPLGLQFRDGGVMYSNKRAVIVLQTQSRSGEARDVSVVPTGHLADGEPVVFDGVRVTRHLVAGLAAAFCGLPPPYEQYSRAAQEVQSNWLWAGGHQPFGPYSNTAGLSASLAAVCRRTLAAGRTDALLRRLRAVLAHVDAFVAQHLGVPFGEALELEHLSAAVKARTTWLDVALTKLSEGGGDPEGVGVDPLPANALEVIREMLTAMERDLLTMSAAAYANEVTEQAALAKQLSAGISELERYTLTMLDGATSAIKCCRLTIQSESSAWGVYVSAVGGMLLAAVVACFMRTKLDDDMILVR